MSSLRVAAVRDVWRRYWPVDLLAVGVLVIVLILASVLSGIISRADRRAGLADVRATRTAQALCAILDRYPAGKDAAIDRARSLGGCGRPHPPTVFLGKPTPGQTVIVRPSPGPVRTVVVVPPVPRSSPAPTATPTRTPHPRPTHTPTPHPTPTPSPSPSPTCVLFICP